LDVGVSRGVKPVDQLLEHLVIEEKLLRGEKKEREAGGRIDFRDSGTLVIVKKDEPLARLVPEEPGQEGYTVFGRALPYKKAKVTLMNPGKNTRLSGDRAVAECDGRFQYNRSSFWVNYKVDNRIKKADRNQAKLVEVQMRIREAIHKLNEAAQFLVFQLDRNEAAEIIVNGYSYPGTYIEICHVSFVGGRMLKAVKFRLDKERGKVLADPLLS
jgi:hypothetical protein